MSSLPPSFADIKRLGPPTTKNGSEWEVPLSSNPPQEWIDAFHNDPGEFSSMAQPRGVAFQRGGLIFGSSDNNVTRWIEYIDKWIARSNENYRRWLEQTRLRADEHRRTQEAEAERVRGLNERFKNL